MDGLVVEGRHCGITTDGRAVLLVWSASDPGVIDDVVDLGPAREFLGETASLVLLPSVKREWWTMRLGWLTDRAGVDLSLVGPDDVSLYPRIYRPEQD